MFKQYSYQNKATKGSKRKKKRLLNQIEKQNNLLNLRPQTSVNTISGKILTITIKRKKKKKSTISF